MTLLAIDPGTTQSGWAMVGHAGVLASGIDENDHLLAMLRGHGTGPVVDCSTDCAIEMIASYGMAVGREVFETCVWIGRFDEAWRARHCKPAALVYRRDVKLHLCGSARAKDPNIRQALLDLLGPQGTKKAPGPTYGVRSHAWAAVGVAVTHLGLRP